VAARYLARSGARTLGVIGCGWQAESQVLSIRAAVPTVERVVAYCRTPERLEEFCERVGAEPAESPREAAQQDVVVTATTSKDPVLRGEWLRPGALVCAIGANEPSARELDNVVLERASFVCCDSTETARRESGDLREPVEQGVLDWLEVHEVQEVVAGETPGRSAADDVRGHPVLRCAPREQEGERAAEEAREPARHGGDCILLPMRRTSREGRFAERVVSGVDDLGVEERIVIWIERKPGALWAVGRAVNPQHRPSDAPRPDDYIFEGYELEDALE